MQPKAYRSVRVGLLALVLFGGHVGGGAQEATGGRELGRGVGVTGDAEVADLHPAFGQFHEVGGFDVAVHHPFAVRMVQGVGHLRHQMRRPGDRQPFGVGGQQRAEGGALQQLHHEIRVPVVLAEVVHDGDAGVLQRGRRLGLPPQPGDQRRVAGQLRQQDLDRHLPVQPLVEGRPHFAHAAPAQPFLQPVPSPQQRPGPDHSTSPSCAAFFGAAPEEFWQ